MRLTKVMMDPAQASRLAASAMPAHRIRSDRVRAYADVMRHGRWVFNAIPVIVSRDGVLLDGHHRLQAGIEAGSSFPTLVASDVSDDVAHLIDRRRVGSFASVLAARGVAEAKSVERLLQQLINYEDGLLGRRAVRQPWPRMERVLTRNPAILEAVCGSNLPGEAEIPEVVRHLLVFMGRRAAPQALMRLLAAMADPASYPADDPGVVLRNTFRAREIAAQRDVQTARLAALGILALNAAQAAGRLPRLAWSYGQDFPRLSGYEPLPGARSEEEADAPPLETDEPESGGLHRAELAIETICPATAERYLRRNQGHGRLIRAHVQALAREMRLGRWILSPQPICFAEGGGLLNGQHRLRALIEAGVSIDMPVARNLPAGASDTYDLHTARSPLKAALPESFGDTPLVHAMANLLWRHEIAPPGRARAKASPEELRAILARHPRLVELRTVARRSVELGRASVLGYAAYVIERQDAKLGQDFLDGLFGVGPTVLAAPVATLRRRMLRLRISRASQEEQLRTIVEAWSQVLARGRL